MQAHPTKILKEPEVMTEYPTDAPALHGDDDEQHREGEEGPPHPNSSAGPPKKGAAGAKKPGRGGAARPSGPRATTRRSTSTTVPSFMKPTAASYAHARVPENLPGNSVAAAAGGRHGTAVFSAPPPPFTPGQHQQEEEEEEFDRHGSLPLPDLASLTSPVAMEEEEEVDEQQREWTPPSVHLPEESGGDRSLTQEGAVVEGGQEEEGEEENVSEEAPVVDEAPPAQHHQRTASTTIAEAVAAAAVLPLVPLSGVQEEAEEEGKGVHTVVETPPELRLDPLEHEAAPAVWPPADLEVVAPPAAPHVNDVLEEKEEEEVVMPVGDAMPLEEDERVGVQHEEGEGSAHLGQQQVQEETKEEEEEGQERELEQHIRGVSVTEAEEFHVAPPDISLVLATDEVRSGGGK